MVSALPGEEQGERPQPSTGELGHVGKPGRTDWKPEQIQKDTFFLGIQGGIIL